MVTARPAGSGLLLVDFFVGAKQTPDPRSRDTDNTICAQHQHHSLTTKSPRTQEK
jgi:hypothetical protein